MNASRLAGSFVALALLLGGTACDGRKQAASMPAPQEPTLDSIAEFCSMSVLEHEGPKGQIFLADRKLPLWFASVRDTVAFTMLPEEPKAITAIYVNDMGRASWVAPEPGTWIEARTAWYVIEARQVGGMAGAEAIPFAEETAARDFAARNGGRVVAFADIPPSYILGVAAADNRAPAAAAANPPEQGQEP